MTRLVGERSPAPGPSSAGRIDAVQARAAVDEDLPGPGLRSATVAAATELAFDLLGDEQQRWQHTRAVVERAGQAADILPEQDVTALLAAAWLHDIGYAPTLRETGFHPLDGAAYLAELGWAPLVSSLVAHHSAARYAAAVAGLARPLGRYDDRAAVAGPLADALTWADQTTSPTGRTVDVHTRLVEMLARHGPDSLNARAHRLRGPEILRAVTATEDALRLRRAGHRLAHH